MQNYTDKEISVPVTKDELLEKFIPWQTHLDENTLGSENGDLMHVIAFKGVPFVGESPDYIYRQLLQRTSALKAISKPEVGIYIYFSKRPVDTAQLNPLGSLTGFPRALCAEIGQQLVADAYEIVWYVAIILGRPTNVKLNFLAFLSNDLKGKDAGLARRVSQLHSFTAQFLSSMSLYKPALLGLKQGPGYYFSEPISFLTWVTQGVVQDQAFTQTGIASRISRSRITFHKNGLIKSNGRYSYSITPIEYEQALPVGVLSCLQNLPFETVFCMSARFIIRADAQSSIKRMISQFIEVGDDGHTQLGQMQEALDQLVSGDISFTRSFMSFRVFGSTPEQAYKNAEVAAAEFGEHSGFIMRRNDIQAKATYLACIPSNWRFQTRATEGLHTRNIAAILTCENLPSGAIHSEWSSTHPVLSLKTIYDTVYHLNLHAPNTDLGHTTIIGQSTGGKTVLLTTLAAMASRFKTKLVYFDMAYGAEVFINAMGGNYVKVMPGSPTGWNPFDMDHNDRSVDFVSQLVMQMLEISNVKIFPADHTVLQKSIASVFTMTGGLRRLSTLQNLLPQGDDTRLSEGLEQWVGRGNRAWLFDNANTGHFDFAQTVFGFDMTEVLGDKNIKNIVFRYLAFLVDNNVVDGTPTMIALDEGWGYIEDEVAGAIVRKWSKTSRRNGVVLVIATNNPKEIKNSEIGHELAVQSPTNIFLASPRSNAEDYSAFDLTPDELRSILALDVTKRQIAIKQGGVFTILNFNFGRNKPSVHVLSSRKVTIPLMNCAIQEYGAKPEQWLGPFMKQATTLRG